MFKNSVVKSNQFRVSKIFSLSVFLLIIVSFYLSPASGFAQVTLAWDANTEENLKGYVVYYKIGSSGPPYDGTGLEQGDSGIVVDSGIIVRKEDLADPNNPTYQLTGFIPDVGYYFAVTA